MIPPVKSWMFYSVHVHHWLSNNTNISNKDKNLLVTSYRNYKAELGTNYAHNKSHFKCCKSYSLTQSVQNKVRKNTLTQWGSKSKLSYERLKNTYWVRSESLSQSEWHTLTTSRSWPASTNNRRNHIVWHQWLCNWRL